MFLQASNLVLRDQGDNGVQDIIAELVNPTSQYTILLPPKQDLLLLQDAMIHVPLNSSAVLDSLLLHVVRGSWPLHAVAQGETFELPYDPYMHRPVDMHRCAFRRPFHQCSADQKTTVVVLSEPGESLLSNLGYFYPRVPS